MTSPSPFAAVDHKAFARDVEALHAELKAGLGMADYRHLLKMVWWSRLSTLIGYSVAWIMPNPVSALLIGIGNMGRWATVTHPVMHRGYDQIHDPHMRRIVWAIFSSMVGVLISMTDANVFFSVTIQIFFWGMVGVGLGIITHLSGRRPTFRVLWRFGEHGD